MAKKIQQRSFDDVLAELGDQRFDVSAMPEGASRKAGAVRVSKYGCAAVIAKAANAPAILLQRPGWVLGGEICRLVDRGYQKFLKNSKLEIPATADILRALHEFTLELDQATGEMALYNESLGTTSDVYLYDRVAGRPDAKRG
jgi:hypothetical protein